MSSLLPYIPIRDLVLYPGEEANLIFGRPGSLDALSDAFELGLIAFSTQHQPEIVEPIRGNIYPVGVVAKPLRRDFLPDGSVSAVFGILQRARIDPFPETRTAQVEVWPLPHVEFGERSRETLDRLLSERFRTYPAAIPIPSHPVQAAYLLASFYKTALSVQQQQDLLQASKPSDIVDDLDALTQAERATTRRPVG